MKKLSLYITLALVSLVFGACSDEYEPWGNPQAYPEEGAVTIPGMKANAVATQDLGTAGEQVSLFTLTAATLPEGYTLQNARMELRPVMLDGATPTTISTTIDGKASTAEVQAMIEKYYGKRVEARNFSAHVYVNAVKGSQAALIDAGTIAVTVIPKKPALTEYLYMAGDANSWNHSMTEPDGFYKVEVNLLTLSYTLTPITRIGIIGDATGSWDNDIAMTYDPTAHGWSVQHVTLVNGEMKFRANSEWKISWGGTDLDHLTSNNGANIKVTAGKYTIKLKPSYDGNTKAELIKE